ncbi:MAG: enoyl-CoA hydratase-related protein [Bacteroidetes bacterium]|nr:enoyl-CoA hydratase-related protein [Rhodothermia bacterium]MCS7155292.1 enoyl-CoA hydratase-related protein [Bacteroidota bacterium]MCX7907877.1 enoyl-CoA hydratase-related protein [Bacteroidota bacterium]MDW8138696.1 enoyl-CoA hydratase-related protein [Bacteroidota bacterium]MDW8284718.1 enoyl-CoA hydratase-related protein [Bacteroidota bacterium]
MYQSLLWELAEGIVTLTINRPQVLNALNEEVLRELEAAFTRIYAEPEVRGVILTGAGPKAFAAGADIAELSQLDGLRGWEQARRGQRLLDQIERCPKPVVAAVNGYALGGGCELAMAAHVRFASEIAQFGQPEVNLGLIPGYGGTQRLVRLVGRGRALELLLSGERISAQRAYEIGLVNRVVPADRLLEEARSFLKAVLSKGPVAVRLILEAVQAADLPLEAGLAREAELFGLAMTTRDFREGTRAFLEKRPPVFEGR